MNLAGMVALLRSNLAGVALGGLVLLLAAVSFWRADALAAAEKQLAVKQVLTNRLGRNVKQAAQLPEQAAALSAARQAIEARILRGAEIGPHAEFFCPSKAPGRRCSGSWNCSRPTIATSACRR
jgi:hypothetical protein